MVREGVRLPPVPLPSLPRQRLLSQRQRRCTLRLPSPHQRLQSQLQQRSIRLLFITHLPRHSTQPLLQSNQRPLHRIRLLFITHLPRHNTQPLLQNNRRPLHNTHLLRHLTQLHLMHLTLHSAHPLLYCTHLLLRPPRPQL